MFLRLTACCNNPEHTAGHDVLVHLHRLHICQPWTEDPDYSWLCLDDAVLVVTQSFSVMKESLRAPNFIEIDVERVSDRGPIPSLIRRDSIMSIERSHSNDKNGVNLVNGFSAVTKTPFEELASLLTMNGIQ